MFRDTLNKFLTNLLLPCLFGEAKQSFVQGVGRKPSSSLVAFRLLYSGASLLPVERDNVVRHCQRTERDMLCLLRSRHSS
jgi:hypothetical protein